MRENGSHEGWFRTGSSYVKMQAHPLLAAAAVAGLGLAMNAVRKARKAQPPPATAGAVDEVATRMPDPTAFRMADSHPKGETGEAVIMSELVTCEGVG